MLRYTAERNVQILIYLLKANNIKKIVISPGTTNLCLVASLQSDSYFELYSSVDERSAAYIACGLAAESGEVVALSCTGATASRNYLSGLTEAYYRKLPVLAITAAQPRGRIGQLTPQMLDRYSEPNDAVKMTVQIPIIKDQEDEWTCNLLINKAILELNHHGKGPVHINIETEYNPDFSIQEIPKTRIIKRLTLSDSGFPDIKSRKTCIFIGSHPSFSKELEKYIEDFCECYDAIVLGDNTSNYKGKYYINANVSCSQEQYHSICREVDLMIHIGEISGAYLDILPSEVWRISPDGEIRDTYRRLTCVFEMNEEEFFEKYTAGKSSSDISFYRKAKDEERRIKSKISELPFSNPWAAKELVGALPENSILHLAILNSLRSWNYFSIPRTVKCYSNVGGFGIDGCMSSAIGAALATRDRLVFLIIGDLSFFYDMNSLGNRYCGKNLRVLLVNNGRGTEFRNYFHPGSRFGEEADEFIAAAHHFGNQSHDLVKHYAEDLGFKYFSATNKEEFQEHLNGFVSPSIGDKSIIFELFTSTENENNALRLIRNTEVSVKGGTKQAIKGVLGEKGVAVIKKIIKH